MPPVNLRKESVPMNIETIQASNPTNRAAMWRNQAGNDNPAGELFTGEFAEADIVGASETLVTGCLLCTGSQNIPCGA